MSAFTPKKQLSPEWKMKQALRGIAWALDRIAVQKDETNLHVRLVLEDAMAYLESALGIKHEEIMDVVYSDKVKNGTIVPQGLVGYVGGGGVVSSDYPKEVKKLDTGWTTYLFLKNSINKGRIKE